MTSIGDFLIGFFEEIGLYYVFAAIFIFLVVYVLFVVFLKQFFKDALNDKQINVISAIFGFVVAMLSITVYGVVELVSYFLSFVVAMLLVILFVFISLTFILGKKPGFESSNPRNTLIVVLVFIVTFIFVAFYFAYEPYLVKLSYGEITNPAFAGFVWIVRPEIIIIPFLFVILGISIMAINIGGGEQKK